MKVISASQYKFSTNSYSERNALNTYNIRRWDWNSIRERRDPDLLVNPSNTAIRNTGAPIEQDVDPVDATGIESGRGRTLWNRTQEEWEYQTVYVVSIRFLFCEMNGHARVMVSITTS
jgi:hypothetical protein